MGSPIWVDGCTMLGRSGTAGGYCPGAQGLRGKDHKEGGRRKASNSSLPNGCVWGQAQSGPGFRVEAKEPPWINELQGQLGIQLCQKHPLARAVSHVFGEISKVQGPGTRPGREPAAPSPLQGQCSTDDTGSHPGCRGRVTPSCWPLAAFETFFFSNCKAL